MGKVCPKCGMESDRDNICTWCGEDLAPKPPAKAEQQEGPPTKSPRARPRRERVQPEEPPSSLRYYLIAGGALVAILAVIYLLNLASAGKPPTEPTDWKWVQSETKKLSLEVPANWKFSTSGSEGTFERATVACGSLYVVSIMGNQAMGALGDVAAASARVSAGEGLPTKTAEERLHETIGIAAAKNDPAMRETGQVSLVNLGNVQAALSEYTTRRRLGLATVQMKGWRLTVPGRDYSYDIRALCPAKNWEKFRPVAERILAGLSFTL